MLAAHLEDHAAPGPVAEALSAELSALASWQGLERVVISPVGNLTGALRAA